MNLLFLGEISVGQTSLMRLRAFERLGFAVRGVHTVQPWLEAHWLARQVQRRFQHGYVINSINQLVLEAADEHRPRIVWAEKQEHLFPRTIEALRRSGALLIHFTPDPYFGLSWKRTQLLDAAMPFFDALVYCKSYEKDAYEAVGPTTVYMPLGFCDKVHRPLPASDPRWQSMVGFLGGWEPRRERLLNAVAATGVDLKIWGKHWNFLNDGRWTLRRAIILRQLAGRDRFTIHKRPNIAMALQGDEVYGDDYARALSGAKIGIGFLRKICPDQHTTRTFEIPACGSMMIADRTDEHMSFFEEGHEAEFFDTTDELIDKIRFYTVNETERRRVAEAGRRRSQKSRYAYLYRLTDALTALGIAIPS